MHLGLDAPFVAYDEAHETMAQSATADGSTPIHAAVSNTNGAIGLGLCSAHSSGAPVMFGIGEEVHRMPPFLTASFPVVRLLSP